METRIYNNTEAKVIRQTLRNNATCPESLLWLRLKGKQLDGIKFRRQYGIGNYIVDFYCSQLKLAIEIDGDSHYDDVAKVRDTEREKYIQSFGINVIRFTNLEVTKNIEGVLTVISKYVNVHTTPSPS